MPSVNDTRTRTRAVIQWSILPLVFITIGLGWKWPLVGFVVPVVMMMGVVGGVFSGRYVCGNLCPRGAFFDRLMPYVSRQAQIPRFMRNMALRWALFGALMGFMVWRISLDGANIYHWGSVFWLMCTITTGVGVVLAVLFHQRGWCSICPIGTAANALGGGKGQLEINSAACRECRVCEKACPIAIPIVVHKPSGVLADRDCVRCDECIARCPARALAWPRSPL